MTPVAEEMLLVAVADDFGPMQVLARRISFLNDIGDFSYRCFDFTLLVSDIMSDMKRPSSRSRVLPQPLVKVTKSDRTRAAILNAAVEFLWSRNVPIV